MYTNVPMSGTYYDIMAVVYNGFLIAHCYGYMLKTMEPLALVPLLPV